METRWNHLPRSLSAREKFNSLLGLFDFAIAIAIGVLTAPGPLQLIVPDRPNAALATFPMVMIPAFAVPSSILLHALSLRQLLRIREAVRKPQ